MDPVTPTTHAARGLSFAEARSRQAAEGFNELPRQERRTPFRIVLEVLREPMLALLLGAGAVYLILGDPSSSSPSRLFRW